MAEHSQSIIYIVFLIFAGTAVLSTLALFTRQSLLVAYIVLGAAFGPWGLKLVQNSEMIKQTGDIGIIFLLFLLGLHLHPQDLLRSLRKMSWITLISSFIFLSFGFVIGITFGFSLMESFIIGITMMFSSTIIGLKLLPTTILHHQHTGELMISILLLQDVIAIAVLLLLQAVGSTSFFSYFHFAKIILAFPILIIIAYIFEHFILARLLMKFDKIHEYIFILSIGWCLCMAELSYALGLSEEIGAFIAGVAIATHPISLYIAESLKPLRDFFLVMFFFTIGASFNFSYLPDVALPALLLATMTMLIKPYTFDWLLRKVGESRAVSWEVGVRLGQISEFSLLVIYLALQTNIVTSTVSYMIQAATIITFIVSCYWVVIRYPTPLAVSDKLRRD